MTVTTRERILDVALEAFARRGYEGTSLREIATELGISKAALYYHFESKQAILAALHLRLHRLGDQLRPLLAEGGGDDEEGWSLLVRALVEIALRNRALLELNLRNQEALAALHHADRRVHGEVDNSLDEEVLSLIRGPALSPETRLLRTATIGAIAGMIFGGIGAVPDEALEQAAAEVARRISGIDLVAGAHAARR